MNYICNNIWSILQTIIWTIALSFAYIARKQFKEDKQIEYYKIEYKIYKDIHDIYCNDPYIAKIIDMWHKESEDIPRSLERVKNKMIKSAKTLQLLLIKFVNKGIKLPDKPDSRD